MAESIVKVPSPEAQGLDFLAFSFNGKHSWDDFGIYRTSDGNRYNENLAPTLNDKTAEVPGGDGMYYFGTTHKQKDFNISFAFDHLTEQKLKKMKKWLSGKEMGDLWFQEAPYKVWTAKPTGNSSIKYIPFDDFDSTGNKIRVYRGEGTVQFTAYWPYAHTPDYIQNGLTQMNGKSLTSYIHFTNKDEWTAASGLTSSTGTCTGENPGDLPAPFILKQDGFIPSGTTFTVGESEITILVDCNNLEWNGKTGLVMTETSGEKRPINFSGNSLAVIPVRDNGQQFQIEGHCEVANETVTIDEEGAVSFWEFVGEETSTSTQENFELNTSNFHNYHFGEEVKQANELNLPGGWESIVNADEVVTSIVTAEGDVETGIAIIPEINNSIIPFIFTPDKAEKAVSSFENIEENGDERISQSTEQFLAKQSRYFNAQRSAVVSAMKIKSFKIGFTVEHDDYEKIDTRLEPTIIEPDEDGYINTRFQWFIQPIDISADVELCSVFLEKIEDEANYKDIKTTLDSAIEGVAITAYITDIEYELTNVDNLVWEKTVGTLDTTTTTSKYERKVVMGDAVKTTVSEKEKYLFKQQNPKKETIKITKVEKRQNGEWSVVSDNTTNPESTTETLPSLVLKYHYWYY